MAPFNPMVGHLGDGDLRVPFARDRTGTQIHVGRVRSRDEGPFVCLGCESELLFRQGEERRQHFAHHAGVECASPLETALHLHAKQVLERERRMRLPELWVTAEFVREKALPGSTETFDRAEFEVSQGNFRPDLVLYRDAPDGHVHPLFVEVRVTHAVDSVKRAKIKARGVSTVEIDLRKVNLLDVEALDAAIIDGAPRTWIFHRRKARLTEKLAAKVKAQEAERRARERQTARAAAERAIAARPEVLAEAGRRLSVTAADRQYAQRDLREAAARAFPRDGQRAVDFLERGHAGLGGISPIQYCYNRRTLETCLKLLDREAAVPDRQPRGRS